MKCFYALIMSLALPVAAQAASYDLTLTASWETADYDVSSVGPSGGGSNPEFDDDQVFGLGPSDGSLSLTLRVDTDSAAFFDAASTGSTHDFYGYSDVSIVGGSFSYGSATWFDDDILSSLIGPDGNTAALWTDSDIAMTAPSLVSFRMIGEWFEASADIFFGTRIGLVPGDATAIINNFSMQEYFGGERLSNSSMAYTASVSPAPVPLPAGGLLLMTGGAAFAVMRRRQSKTK